MRTFFFRENKLDREVVAQELADVLELPPLRSALVKVPGQGARQGANRKTTQPDLFISYFHRDADFVERLAEAVARGGYSVWYDRIGLTAGDVFPREIEHALAATRFIGFVCTEGAFERPWVQREVYAGLSREDAEGRDIIIPLRLSGCELPLLLQTKQWCDFASRFDTGLAALFEALAH